MNRFEDELSKALERKEPPPGFAGRVIAQAEAGARRREWFRFPVFRWALAAACCLVLVAGAQIYRERRERARGEAAKAQLMQAVRIAGGKLHLAQMKVQEAGEHRFRLPKGSI